MSLLEENQSTDLEKMVGLSRRGFISAGALCGAAMFLGGNLLSRSALATGISAGNSRLLGFESIPAATTDVISLPKGYKSSVLISWGQPLHKNGPAFDPSGNGTAAAQEVQFGDNNDGMSLFEFPDDRNRALMAINNEYTNYRYPLPARRHAAIGRRRAQGAGLRRCVGDRSAAQERPMAVRPGLALQPAHPRQLAAAHQRPGRRSRADEDGRRQARQESPWHLPELRQRQDTVGTYLTCEENFTDCFGSSNAQQQFDPAQKRYGVSAASREINWHPFDPRFDMAKNPNELNRHGWVVEIDPFDPQSTPVKRTALGRFKHENAALAETNDGRAVVYMGDDERGEFIYKFVSRDRINHRNAKANRNILDHGTLYVAKFDAGDGNPDHPKGQGQWIELTHGKNGIDASSGFADQAEVLIHARLAASVVGATRMDRPEWIVVSPKDGQVYCTLTNNAKRGEDGQPVGGPNPRAKNVYGQILRWRTDRDDHASKTFAWDLFVVAGNPGVHVGTPKGGSSNITPQNMFNSPDGLGFDKAGRLWILTDGDSSNAGDFAGMGNNQMLCADPKTGEIRRFMVGRLVAKSPGSASHRIRRPCLSGFSTRARTVVRPSLSICRTASRDPR